MANKKIPQVSLMQLATPKEMKDTINAIIDYCNQGFAGTEDYKTLINKPKINGTELVDDKSFEDLGLSELSVEDINKMLIEEE
jgi:hypothetical protein